PAGQTHLRNIIEQAGNFGLRWQLVELGTKWFAHGCDLRFIVIQAGDCVVFFNEGLLELLFLLLQLFQLILLGLHKLPAPGAQSCSRHNNQHTDMGPGRPAADVVLVELAQLLKKVAWTTHDASANCCPLSLSRGWSRSTRRVKSAWRRSAPPLLMTISRGSANQDESSRLTM